MNAELTEIARRFVACPGWKPIFGMRATVIDGWARATPLVWDGHGWADCDGDAIYSDCDIVLDLDDELTAAGILPVVRRAWGRDMWVREDEEGGYICEALCKSPALMSIERLGVGLSELLALLDALEAAPK